MGQSAGAYHINCLKIHHYTDIHLLIQQISTAFQLLTDLYTLPGVPIGDMVKFRFYIDALQFTGFCQFVFRAAMVAPQCNALTLGFSLGLTVGAFI